MFKEVDIPVEKQFVNCKLFEAKENPKNTCVVLVHGWTSSDKKYLPLAEVLSKNGFNSLALTLRGHGESRYPLSLFSREDHLQDVVSAVEYMKKNYPNTKIVLLGKSYGGYLASLATKEVKVDFLILSQPALYPDEQFSQPTKRLIEQNPDIFRVTNQTPEKNRALSAIAEFENPILLIESENDEEVPRSTTILYEKYARKDKFLKVVLKDADHSLTKEEYKQVFYATLTDWVKKGDYSANSGE